MSLNILNSKMTTDVNTNSDENRYWKANWIWDKQQPEQDSAKQLLVYFRKSFTITEPSKHTLILDITADSRYILFINGHRVSIGPCKSTAQAHYYDTVDVSNFLRCGKNVIAVKVLRFPSIEPFQYGEGGSISIWRSHCAGLFVEANIFDENNQLVQTLHTDASWKTYRHTGYEIKHSSLIHWMGGLEYVDSRKAPLHWHSIQFDDALWHSSIVFAESKGYGLLNPWKLTARPIPFLYEQEKSFVYITRNSHPEINFHHCFHPTDTSVDIVLQPHQSIVLELDAGQLTTGYLYFSMKKGRGSIIRILCAECYEANESTEINRIKGNREDVTGKLLGDYDSYIVTGTSADENSVEVYEPFWFRTFRFVRIEILVADEPLQLINFAYRETGYPLELKASFRCSDEQLNTIWDLSVRTLQCCMHETYEDCPYYEQLQYAMDSRLMMLYTYYLSADDTLARRTITDFYQSRMPSGLLQSRYPSSEPQVIPSFSLYWIDMLAEHYEYFADIKLIKQYRPAMLELLDWFDKQLTEDGIVGVTSNHYWTYFDWVDAWPLGAPPESKERPMIQLSLMYAVALRKASYLLKECGWNEVANECEIRADHICLAVTNVAWSHEKQLFRELPETEIYTQHAQILAVLAGAITGIEANKLIQRALTTPMHQVTLPYTYLLMQAMKKVGLEGQMFQLWNRWRNFANEGLTTLPEVEVNPRSDCHAWSAVPLAQFPASILGVTPEKPGYEVIRIKPIVEGLTWAKGKVATTKGLIDVDWSIKASILTINVKAPDSVPFILCLPNDTEQQFTNEITYSIPIP